MLFSVCGEYVPSRVTIAVTSRMQEKDFRWRELMPVVKRSWPTHSDTMARRAVDRLIQHNRTEGRIRMVRRGLWTWSQIPKSE